MLTNFYFLLIKRPTCVLINFQLFTYAYVYYLLFLVFFDMFTSNCLFAAPIWRLTFLLKLTYKTQLISQFFLCNILHTLFFSLMSNRFCFFTILVVIVIILLLLMFVLFTNYHYFLTGKNIWVTIFSCTIFSNLSQNSLLVKWPLKTLKLSLRKFKN